MYCGKAANDKCISENECSFKYCMDEKKICNIQFSGPTESDGFVYGINLNRLSMVNIAKKEFPNLYFSVVLEERVLNILQNHYNETIIMHLNNE